MHFFFFVQPYSLKVDSPNKIKTPQRSESSGVSQVHNERKIKCLGIYPDICSSASLLMSAAFRRVSIKYFLDSHREPAVWFSN